MSNFHWWFRRRWGLKLAEPFSPVLSSLVPNTCLHGIASQALTVNGQHFKKAATLKFGTSNYSPSFVSELQLTTTILPADIATAGSKSVTVTNVDGRTSGALTFTIT